MAPLGTSTTTALVALTALLSSSSCMAFILRPTLLGRRLLSRASARALSSTTDTATTECTGCSLPFETLPYRGAEVRVPKLDDGEGGGGVGVGSPIENDSFLTKLRSALTYWSENDYNSAWLHIPSSRASLVESLTAPQHADLSFDLHHVNSTESTIVLKKWLRTGAEDKVPPFATHQVGCAGFVLSEENEVLLVREWTGPPSDRTPTKQWKLPGGLLDAGESFEEASCREVVEETGVDCDFESVLAFWHRHGLTFGKSDFYFVSMLRPRTKIINIDPVEVSDAIWMPLEEFVRTQDHPLILHVLRNVFKLGGVDGGDFKLEEGGERLKPAVEMVEGDIQFGSRAPFLTYTGHVSGDRPS